MLKHFFFTHVIIVLMQNICVFFVLKNIDKQTTNQATQTLAHHTFYVVFCFTGSIFVAMGLSESADTLLFLKELEILVDSEQMVNMLGNSFKPRPGSMKVLPNSGKHLVEIFLLFFLSLLRIRHHRLF